MNWHPERIDINPVFQFIANWHPSTPQMIVICIIIAQIHSAMYVHGAMALNGGARPSKLVETLSSFSGFLIGLALFRLWMW